MPTVRLNTYNRSMLLKMMLDKGNSEDCKSLLNMEHVIAAKLYSVLYKPHELEQMQNLPRGWLREESSIQVKTGHHYHEFNLDGPRRFLHSTKSCALSLDARDKLSDTVEQYLRERNRVHAAREELRQHVRSVLNSVTTVARLLEVWPQAKEFTEKLDLSRPALPALPIKALNKMLGLAV